MVFQFVGDDQIYTMPLAASMPAKVILELQEAYKGGETEAFKGQMEVLRIYIGEKVDELTAGEIRDVFNAWAEESSDQGTEVGE